MNSRSAVCRRPHLLLVVLVFVSLTKHHSDALSPNIMACKAAKVDSLSRRDVLRHVSTWTATIGALQVTPVLAASSDIVVTVQKPGDRVNLELYNVQIGSPPKPAVAIKHVLPGVSNNKLQTGMVLQDFTTAEQVQERLKRGPYPVQLQFRDLAGQGDAISDLGTPIVTAEDALELAKRTSGNAESTSGSLYSITALKKESTCGVQSRRNDVLEIIYQAHLNGPNGVIYDSSISRGTGQPYQMVLGSGDMLPGVDQGLYDMCPGEVRGIQIPPPLAYGNRGNKLFRIPPNTSLYWEVELVSVNSVRQGDLRSRDEIEQRAEYTR